ncbi:PrpF domain-containing protein [Candidatus Pantoea multigeneris]|uniref:PrpF protein n=1 Tax=Candidatus Pantoea multigeneris TaxID=2608357 RepID=A0ABX0R9J7_9GAMM|nr:PrpF domain-containing protein [Pantoea multigeneris]NIF21163.1 hypothetical protein [Pantoea multigeneris]
MITIPVYYVRGGTSSGAIFFKNQLPSGEILIEEILRKTFGVPLDGENRKNKQVEGIGKSKSTTNKAFIIDIDKNKKFVISNFAQLEATSNQIAWNVNCGNMSSAIPLVLHEAGLIKTIAQDNEITINNINTGKTLRCRIYPRSDQQLACCKIPGINEAYPRVDVAFVDPEGSKTGLALPTGNVRDRIHGVEVSCVDVVVPMVIIAADSLGLKGDEQAEILLTNPSLLQRIDAIRIEAGLRMKLRNKAGNLMSEQEIAVSTTLPKVGIVARSQLQQRGIRIIYLTPKEVHGSIAVSGGSCLAYACAQSGSIAADIFPVSVGESVPVEHYAGISEFEIDREDGRLLAKTVRNAQIIIKGEVMIHNPSPALLHYYSSLAITA